jgi:hypothetical protein
MNNMSKIEAATTPADITKKLLRASGTSMRFFVALC